MNARECIIISVMASHWRIAVWSSVVAAVAIATACTSRGSSPDPAALPAALPSAFAVALAPSAEPSPALSAEPSPAESEPVSTGVGLSSSPLGFVVFLPVAVTSACGAAELLFLSPPLNAITSTTISRTAPPAAIAMRLGDESSFAIG